jgi:hypothetical protein
MKPWPFRGWGLNFIGEVLLSSSKGHRFILIAADYFTKWVEAVPLRNMTHREVIRFVQQHVIHQFGIPQSLTTDQGASFMSHQFKEFVNSMRIKLLNSSPYYAQTNGQAESSNKTLIKIIKKWIESSPRKWRETMSKALWAHRKSRHGSTKVMPFELTYEQEIMLPVEINLNNDSVSWQDRFSAGEYGELMMDTIDEVSESWLRALEEIEKEKVRIAKTYNKRVKKRSFQVGDLVWKTILPLGTRSNQFEKWSPS